MSKSNQSANGCSPENKNLPPTRKPRGKRDWAPDHDDDFIYNMVKFDGMTQEWVANLLEISQSTVSRVIQRYERWQAHAKARADGQLDRAERLRVTHWLTFERNERILGSCLRIANEMEREGCVSKTTTSRPLSHPSAEREVRQQSSSVDRHGIASRFLRLAFRINMEQHKLAQAEEPPLPSPLTDEQIEEESRQAAQYACEWRGHWRNPEKAKLEAEVREEVHRRLGKGSRGQESEDGDHQAELIARLKQQEERERAKLARQLEDELAQAAEAEVGQEPAPEEQTCEAPDTVRAVHNVHNLHNGGDAESAATPEGACACDQPPLAEKNSSDACITPQDESAATNGRSPRRRGSTSNGSPSGRNGRKPVSRPHSTSPAPQLAAAMASAARSSRPRRTPK